MERFDVLVVGAGPAGSTAAHALATAGARVLLVDRASFPRDKPCGGGLTTRAVRQLDVAVDPVVEDVVETVEVRLRYGRRFERRGRTTLCLMTQRRRLDELLAARAVDAGAEFRDGVPVTDVTENGARVGGARVVADVLLGADGANGTTARSLGLAADVSHGVALEGNVPYAAADEARFRGRLVLELAVLPGGYAWVFPKGDHVNVGVGGWRSEGPRLREHLRRLCAIHGIDPAAVTDTRGHRLPYRTPRTRIVGGRAALVGDAAGLVDPVSGDGMYEAIVSAKLAAAAALDVLAGRAQTLEPYAAALGRAIGPLTAAGWGAKVALDRFPRTTFAVMRLPPTWRALEQLLVADTPNPSALRGLERRALKLVELVARRAGHAGEAFAPA
jgi:geranylgeranyl reductase family protein